MAVSMTVHAVADRSHHAFRALDVHLSRARSCPCRLPFGSRPYDLGSFRLRCSAIG
jgi:hypothetical protein